MAPFRTLTFDLFGTVLDLGGSLTPYIRDYLEEKKCKFSPEGFWSKWRERQRIEQFRDTIMMLGHCGYLEAARRALKYVFAQIGYGFPYIDDRFLPDLEVQDFSELARELM